jgi:hypothetical protein
MNGIEHLFDEYNTKQKISQLKNQGIAAEQCQE